MSLVKKHITEPYFSQIFNGSKVAEGRVITPEFWNLDLLGKQFTFHNNRDEFDVLVTRIDAYYGSNKREAVINMLKAIGYRTLLPNITDFEAAVDLYMSFGDAITTRVAAFYVEVVSDMYPHTP